MYSNTAYAPAPFFAGLFFPNPLFTLAAALAGFLGSLLIITMPALAFQQRTAPAIPLALSVNESAGQLMIRWTPGALGTGGSLLIDDGGKVTRLALTPSFATVTYEARSTDVKVQLSRFDAKVPAEVARFLVSEDPRHSLARQIQKTAEEAQQLRQDVESQLAWLTTLQWRADRMLAVTTPSVTSNGRFWR